MEDDDTRLARIGYEAYGAEAGWKNYQGLPMPRWDELPEGIRRSWKAAARAIGEQVTRERDV